MVCLPCAKTFSSRQLSTATKSLSQHLLSDSHFAEANWRFVSTHVDQTSSSSSSSSNSNPLFVPWPIKLGSKIFQAPSPSSSAHPCLGNIHMFVRSSDSAAWQIWWWHRHIFPSHLHSVFQNFFHSLNQTDRSWIISHRTPILSPLINMHLLESNARIDWSPFLISEPVRARLHAAFELHNICNHYFPAYQSVQLSADERPSPDISRTIRATDCLRSTYDPRRICSSCRTIGNTHSGIGYNIKMRLAGFSSSAPAQISELAHSHTNNRWFNEVEAKAKQSYQQGAKDQRTKTEREVIEEEFASDDVHRFSSACRRLARAAQKNPQVLQQTEFLEPCSTALARTGRPRARMATITLPKSRRFGPSSTIMAARA